MQSAENSLNVLHITSSFPDKENPFDGIFIKNHIESLDRYVKNFIICSKIKNSRFPWVSIHSTASDRLTKITIYKGFFPYRISLLVNTIIVALFGIYYKWSEKVDLVNFHFVYPNLVFRNLMSFLIRRPIVITEHLTSYNRSYNNLPSKDKKRLIACFKENDFLISVSKALSHDIMNFTKLGFQVSIVPNVVNNEFFHYQDVPKQPFKFFSAAGWRIMKRPLLMLQAFDEAIKEDNRIQLFIGGSGEMTKDILNYIEEHDLSSNIFYLGNLTPEEMANEMRTSQATVLSSSYETFSVLAAESLCCGTPIIIPPLAAILEYANDNSAIVFDDTCEDLKTKILQTSFQDFNRKAISKFALSKFSKDHVGGIYYEALRKTQIEQVWDKDI